ncbi:histidine kinase [Alphaproteobacteria bacterium]|nr:histidine kinase [Alphaproteobacteria bacterium]
MLNCFCFLKKIVEFSANRVGKHGARYVAFGVFSVINYMLPMYMFSQRHPESISVLVIRVTAILLSFFLAISETWPSVLKKYLPVYWHFTMMFCLPFMVTYMTFFDGISIFWVINIAIALMLGLILLDFLSFTIIFPTGIVSAIVVSNALGTSANLIMPNYLLYPSFYLLLFAIGITITFFRDTEKEYDCKIKAMKAIAGAIAHEIRTPISIIMSVTKNINSQNLKENELHELDRKKGIITKEGEYIIDTIDMILMKLSNDLSRFPLELTSIEDFMIEAIERYPFFVNEQKLVHLNVEKNFYFCINKHLMMHVIFNIIQNALYQIKEANKGEIFITIKQSRKRNILSIKDTASGIQKSRINSIFDPFVTHKESGTGIGLDFCKRSIVAMNGDLKCQSEYGKYAEFIIEFYNEANQ